MKEDNSIQKEYLRQSSPNKNKLGMLTEQQEAHGQQVHAF